MRVMGKKKQHCKQNFGWKVSRYCLGVCPVWEDNTKMSVGKIGFNVNWKS
jgi:hypothetical protein